MVLCLAHTGALGAARWACHAASGASGALSLRQTPRLSSLQLSERRRRPKARSCARASLADVAQAVAAAPGSIFDVIPVEAVFNFENSAVVIFWAPMIVAPGWQWTRRVIGSQGFYAVYVGLALIYAYLIAASTTEPAVAEGFAESANLASLTRAFSYEVTVALGWAHFITFDLFVGRWVYLDGQRNRVFTSHSILLCLFLGPLGLLSHLVTRQVMASIRGEPVVDALLEGSQVNSEKLEETRK